MHFRTLFATGSIWPILLLISCLIQCSRCQLKYCYYTDGSIAQDFPCDPDAEVSACCGPGSFCETSLYCVNHNRDSVIGSCTDKSFTDNACPFQLSRFVNFDFKLNTTRCDDGTFCPKADPDVDNTTCCANGQGKSEIHYSNYAMIPSSVDGLSTYYAAASYSIPNGPPGSDTASRTSPITSFSPTGSGSAPSSSGIASTVTNSTVLITAPSSTIAPTDGSSGTSTSTKAAIGVGVVAAVAILGLIGFAALYRRNRNSQANIVPPGSDQPIYNGGGRP